MAETTFIYSPSRAWRAESHWTFQRTSLAGKTRKLHFFEQMTPPLNSEQLAEHYEKAKEKENPRPANFREVWETATLGYDLQATFPEQAESLRNTLQNGMRRYANTTTVVAYNPEGQKDELIHNYQTSDAYSVNGEFVGKDSLIQNVQPFSLLEAILGTRDIAEINNIAQWLNNTPAYLWRVNSKPQERDERVAGFGAFSGRLDLYCSWGLHYQYPAFRVLVEE